VNNFVNWAGTSDQSVLEKDSSLMLHGESNYVHVHEKFHPLNPVDENMEGTFCYNLTESEFELLNNGSLLLLRVEKIVDFEEFCNKSEARLCYF
jgi:hypothetical protein